MKFIITLFLFILLLLCNNFSFGQLNGDYTIKPSGTNFNGNPNGIGGKNYTTINNAVNALKTYGVSGQVSFDIDSGSYNEQISIPVISGVSATKHVIFRSAKSDSTSVTIYWASPNKDTNYTIMLDGADYITFSKLSIVASGKYYGYAIVFRDGADNNVVTNCILKSEMAASDQFACIYSLNSYDINNQINNNNLTGGFYSIYLNSPGSATGNIINNNIINDYYSYGIYSLYQDGLVIKNNIIENSKSPGLLNGITTSYCNYVQISANKIILTPSYLCYGINMTNASASSSNHAQIINNFISILGNYSSTYYGIGLTSCTYQDVAYNTICMTAPASFSFGVYMSGTATNGAFLTNNIISHEGGGFTIFTGNTQPLAYSDYNDLYSTGTYLCHYSSDITSLSAWQSATGKDYHSLNVNPNFFSKSDLHINNYQLDGKGLPITGITKDIDEDTRSASTPDIGADEFTPIMYDAGVVKLEYPAPACVGSNTISVKIKNFGIATLTSLTVNWSVDGVTKTPVVLSSVSIPQYQEQTVSLGTLNFADTSNYKIKFWTSVPNSQVDEKHSNDTLTINNFRIGLADTFIIGTSPSDYQSFTEAISDLSERGICNSVVFRVKSAKYIEKIEIQNIKGSSATKTITFESIDQDSSTTILQYGASSLTDNYVVKLNGASFIRFSSISIKALGSQYGKAIVMTNGASNNIFSHNIIQSSTGSTSTDIVGIYNSPNSLENNNLIEYNVITGGAYGISFNGISNNSFELNNIVRNNQIINFSYYGIHLNYEKYPTITANFIKNNIASGNIYGIYGSYLNDTFKINGNQIEVSGSNNNYGIFLSICGTIVPNGMIFNNFILQTGNSTAINYGIYLINNQAITIQSNNVKITSTSTANGRALFASQGNNLDFRNNILSNFGGGYAVYFTPSIPTWTIVSNYNDLYTIGTYLGCKGSSNFTNLTNWKSGTGYDINSLSVDPYFVSANDLHVHSKALDSAGYYNPKITKDIDGDPRNSNKPDIGADEFTLLNYDLAISSLVSPISPCSGSLSNVSVKILNYGVVTVKNTKLKWSINGALQTPKSVLCNLLAAKDTIINIGSYTFNSGTNYIIKVWVDSLNGHADENNLNDTLITSNIITGMNGNYTIGPNGRDYKNFTEAVKDLKIKGVCGTVVFTADSGIYNEQISIPQISGTSTVNTITFRAASSDSTKTIIQYAATSINDNYVIQLDGADYIRFEKFYLKGLGSGLYAQVIGIKNGANYNIFSNNKLESNLIYSAGNSNIFNDQSSADNYNIFKYNHFKYGSRLISFSGVSETACEKGNQFLYNILDSFNYYGMYIAYQDSLQIVGNVLKTNAAPFGIYLYFAYNLSRITSNEVHLEAVTYQTVGIALNNITGKSSQMALITNNMVTISGNNNFQIHGIYSNLCYSNKMYHNSINISASTTNTTCAAVYFTSSNKGNYGNITFMNNMIVNTGGGYAIYVDASAATLGYLQISNYNNIFSNGNYLGFYNKNNAATLPEWKFISGKDASSKSEMPPFYDITDLHLKTFSSFRVFNALTEAKTDIDGENRSPLFVVIGADENPVFPLDAGILYSVNPKTAVCEGVTDFTIRICNFGTSKLDSVDIRWIVNGDTQNVVRYKGNLNHLQETNVFLGYDTLMSAIHNSFIAEIVGINGKSDQYSPNNVLIKNDIKVFLTPKINKKYSDTICKNTDAILKVSGNTKKYYWYNVGSGGTPISEDTFLIRKKVATSETFYVEAVSPGNPDSFSTQKVVSFNQNMGNMFNIRALTADVIIDSFAINPNAAKGAHIPVALYYKTGTYRGFEKDSTKWTFAGYDTVISNGPLEFTTISLGNVKIKKNDSMSFYLSTTNDAYLLYSSDGDKAYLNSSIRIATGCMTYYKFDSLFQSKKSWNGKVYYSTGSLCKSQRDTVKAIVLSTPDVNLGKDTAFCSGKWLSLDAGEGPGFSYVWKFGTNPDTISTMQKLKLDSNGTYIVTVSDTCGNSSTDQINLTINPSPVTAFTINDSSQCFRYNKFIFNNLTSISSGSIKSYLWSFGDGQTSNTSNPQHFYQTADTFQVNLISTSDKGCSDTLNFNKVVVFPTPKADFSINNDTQCFTGNRYIMTNSSSIHYGNINFYWSFGDGSLSYQSNPQYSYSKTGYYEVLLITKSDNDCNDSIIRNVLVKPSPTIFLGNDTTLKTTQKIVLRAGKGYDSYLWSGGELSDSVTVSSSFKTNKIVWVKVELDGCFGSDTIVITFDTLIGINELKLFKFFCYPNPASNSINIQMSNNIEKAFFVLNNLQGKTLITGTIQQPNFKIDLSELPKGPYFLQIFTDENMFIEKIFRK